MSLLRRGSRLMSSSRDDPPAGQNRRVAAERRPGRQRLRPDRERDSVRPRRRGEKPARVRGQRTSQMGDQQAESTSLGMDKTGSEAKVAPPCPFRIEGPQPRYQALRPDLELRQ